MNSAVRPLERRGLVMLAAVTAVFVLPILIAWLLASGTIAVLPKGRVNHGNLIEPLLELGSQTLMTDANTVTHLDRRFGEWTLATIIELPCAVACRDALDRMRRVHLALREEMDRVHLAAFVDDHASTGDLSSLGAAANTRVYRTDARELIERLRRAGAIREDDAGFDRLIVIDYAARAMMIFPAHADMGGVVKDLTRLLRASKTAG